VKTLLFLAKSLLYGWVIAARNLCAAIRRICEQSRGEKIKPRQRCIPINNPAFVQPDPLIYDQYYLTSLGLAVTWDNPDIQLYLNGAPVSSSLLQPATTYEIVAQIWNNSTDAPVAALPVSFSYLEFGVGTVSIPIGSTTVNLGVKGSSKCPAYATMPWTTPAIPGHYCLQALLEPFDDSNFNNNLGQENTNVGTAQSPAVFTLTLRNDTRRTQSYRFEVDAYNPGTPDPCEGTTIDAKTRNARLARHRRGSQPLPAGWQVKIEPEGPSLAPGQSIPLTVTATPPAGLTGNQPLNVNAFHAGGIAGGVTLTVNMA
jgi:hypothetical protein